MTPRISPSKQAKALCVACILFRNDSSRDLSFHVVNVVLNDSLVWFFLGEARSRTGEWASAKWYNCNVAPHVFNPTDRIRRFEKQREERRKQIESLKKSAHDQVVGAGA